MSSDSRPKARLPRGFRDRDAGEIAAERTMLARLARVYETYGFQALETPAFEYTDALGKFLPDSDRPNEGVFSLKDEDGQWLSLRYDLTAPLARYVAENFQNIPKPFRRYQTGTVWRNEKPGPGRYREFTQFDADVIGTASPAADAELVMMMADALEELGLKRGEYAVKVNSRKLLDGVLEAAGVDMGKRGIVLRAIDKMDRLGAEGVRALLGAGRKDESGDFSSGAGLSSSAINDILFFVGCGTPGSSSMSIVQNNTVTLANCESVVGSSTVGKEGISELAAIKKIIESCGYDDGRVVIDPSVVRGLDYYTGAVFEAQLTFPVQNEAGETVVFGSVGGGGRYDDLVARFTGQTVPATGMSIGISRLLSALRARGVGEEPAPLILVLAMEKENMGASLQLAREIRASGLRAEAYVGESGMKAQFKYADRRGAAIAVIEGSDERAKGEITLKDLALGAELAKDVASRADWVKDRPAQETVKKTELIGALRTMLGARQH